MTTFVASYTRLSSVLLVMTQRQYLHGSRRRGAGSTRQMRPMTPVYDERDVGPSFNHADSAARVRRSDVCQQTVCWPIVCAVSIVAHVATV